MDLHKTDPEGEFWISALLIAIGSLLLFLSFLKNDNKYKSAYIYLLIFAINICA